MLALTCRRILPLLAAFALTLAMFGCEAKITQANYDKIDKDMSLSQVERILGGAGVDETPSGTSITGAGIGDSRKAKVNVYRWRDGSKQIVVTFKDGKMFEKTQEGL